MRFKKFHDNIDAVDYDDLDNYDDNYDFADNDEHRKIGSIRNLEETRTIYSANEPVENFMGSNTEDVIDKLLNTILQRFQQPQETSNDNESEFIPESVELLYYYFQKTNIRRAESWVNVSRLDSK